MVKGFDSSYISTSSRILKKLEYKDCSYLDGLKIWNIYHNQFT